MCTQPSKPTNTFQGAQFVIETISYSSSSSFFFFLNFLRLLLDTIHSLLGVEIKTMSHYIAQAGSNS
jgi:hypothetical protein